MFYLKQAAVTPEFQKRLAFLREAERIAKECQRKHAPEKPEDECHYCGDFNLRLRICSVRECPYDD